MRLEHIPTELEKKCDSADIEMLHELYGSRAQTIINILLGFDGYFNWYAPTCISISHISRWYLAALLDICTDTPTRM